MPTQNVNLTQELETFVKSQVATGHFNNASEVHRSALSAMARREEERQARLERLRREIQVGIEEADGGDLTEIAGRTNLRELLDTSFEEAMSEFDRENAEAVG